MRAMLLEGARELEATARESATNPLLVPRFRSQAKIRRKLAKAIATRAYLTAEEIEVFANSATVAGRLYQADGDWVQNLATAMEKAGMDHLHFDLDSDVLDEALVRWCEAWPEYAEVTP